MRDFARLYNELDATTATLGKLDALKRYFSHVEPANAAWAVYFLAGGKPRQTISTKFLRQFSTEMSGIPEWLFDECYQAVGDLAETIALLWETDRDEDVPLHQAVALLSETGKAALPTAIAGMLDRLGPSQRLAFLKLATGNMRIGLSAPGLARPDGRCIEWMPGRMFGLEGLDWSAFLDREVNVLNDAHAALLGEVETPLPNCPGKMMKYRPGSSAWTCAAARSDTWM